MPKPSKRKAEAISFSDDKEADDGGAEGEGSASDDDDDNNNNDNDGDDDDDELDNNAKTPAQNRTPTKQKTPGSSPGMTMRSGRKKKRPKKGHAAAAAAANAAGADGNVTKRAKTGQNGSANNAWKDILDEDKKDDDDDEDEEMKQNDEEDEEMEEEDEEEEQTPPGGTVKKVPPETTRKAVAEAQVTESTEEDEKGEGEGGAATSTAGQTSASSVAGAASSAGAAPTNGSGNGSSSSGVLGAALGGGGGGILRLVTQTLRLPSQQTPKPPTPSANEVASGTTPLPPPGRKLIFDTAKKSTAAAPGGGGGRNKLLMQTRQLPQTGSQNEETEGMRSVQRQHFRPRNGEDAAVGEGPQSATQSNETQDEDDMSMDAMKKDVILYTKAWFALLFLCFFVGNVANVVMGNDSLSGALGRWNVKEQGARYVEWYGLQQQLAAEVITDMAEEDQLEEEEEDVEEEDSHQEEEVITQTITITDPNLLSSARAKLRAHRMNLHDIQKHEFDRKELQVGLELMEGSVEEWKGRYADLDFGSADKKEMEKGEDGEGGEEDVVGWIKRKIESNDVVIFSKSQCPHSQETKDLFISWQSSKKDVKISHMEVIELDLQPNNKGKEMQNELFKMTKQFTVPNVFVKGKHVGGNVQVQMAASNGELKKMLEVPRLGDEKKDKNNLDGTTATVNDALEKIGNMRTSIDARWDKLSEWKYALNDLDEVLDSLEKGESGHVDVNKAMEELSKVSLISSEAMLLDVDKINVPGEGCQGMDYPLLKQEEEVMEMEEKDQEEEVEVEIEEEVPEFEEEMVEVVGGIDMDALDYASDTPVLTEEAQTAYESLLKLAQSTSEAIFGASGPSSYANQWAEQIVQEELHKVGVGGKPPPIDEVHDPIVSEAAMASIVAPANNNDAAEYTTDDAVRDIDRALEKEDADRTGKFDYASATHGARVLRRGPYATSYSLFETLPLLNRVLAYTKLRFYGHPPETALYPTNPAHARGQCWSFANEFLGSRSRRKAGLGMTNDLVGEYATLTVSLTSAITVSEVMVEHVPPSVSSNPSTAIKEFRVLGFEDGGAFGDPWELGTFKHLIGPSYQKFSIPTVLDGQNVPKLKAISIAVDSNWGADYSCLYRVRVHGS